MTTEQEQVAHFIRLVRGISPQWLRYACTHGACHRFYLVLRHAYPSARPYWVRMDNGRAGHVVSKIHGRYWDIWGEWTGSKPRPFTARHLEQMSSCHFDEGFVMENPHLMREYDRIEEVKK